MQCILQLPEDFEQWLGKEVRGAHGVPITWVAKNAVGLVTHDFETQFRALVASAKQPNAAESAVNLAAIVNDIREVLPLGEVESGVNPDLVLGLETKVPTFLDTLATGALEAALESRRVFAEGTTRTAGYGSAFHNLARLAHSIDIMDPYAATALTDDERDGGWLLVKLLSDAPQAKIKIFTKIQEDKPNHFLTQTQKLDELKSELERLIADVPAFEGHLYVDVRKRSPKFHKRMIRFRFTRGAVATLLDNGLGTFAHPAFQAPEEFLPSRVFTSYLDAVKKATERIGEEMHIRN
jgi:hypothetical protein